MKHLRDAPLRPEQAERVKQWRDDSYRRAPDGRRIWRCWHCDKLEPWGPTWNGWYSYKEMEDGAPLPMWCSEECRTFLAIKGVVPRDTPALAEAAE